ncbi:MAG TPA: exosortase O [Anaerolineae bacterium]|nr:exosortase O [Anaerolineae bacterium]
MVHHIQQQPLNNINREQLAWNGLLILAWLWLFTPLFPYVQMIFSRQDFRTNQFVLIAIGVMLLRRWQRTKQPLRWDATWQWRPWPLTLLIGGAALFWLCERWLDINVLSATLAVISAYGLLGLWLPPARWRAGLPLAMLLAGTLPINTHLQTFVGYPLRLATAAAVRDGLALFGIGSVGVDTILVLENGMTHVDVPCSGVNSLWTGGMFLLAISWLEHKRLDWRWLLIGSILLIALILSNFIRVAILVLTGTVLNLPILADMLHVPLGLLGFIGSCLFALWLLRQAKSERDLIPVATDTAPPPMGRSSRALIIITTILLAGTYQSTVRATTLVAPPAWPFPDKLVTEAYPLAEESWAWLEQDGAKAAERLTFTYGSLSGTMLFVIADNWHAHHNPERCFEGSGWRTLQSQTHLVATDFPVRQVTLGNGNDERSAVYWFQSSTQITDDYATRIWADVDWQRDEWVLVTVAFDGDVDWAAAEGQAFLHDLRNVMTKVTRNDF